MSRKAGEEEFNKRTNNQTENETPLLTYTTNNNKFFVKKKDLSEKTLVHNLKAEIRFSIIYFFLKTGQTRVKHSKFLRQDKCQNQEKCQKEYMNAV